MFDTGFDIRPDFTTMEFVYGADTFGPATEKRRLDDIRKSLSDPTAKGPDIVYSVAMDVGQKQDHTDLVKRNLLYGAMIYAKGQVGKEPVRSQGHIHAISPSCGKSTPEVYEIWSGRAVVYMQQTAEDDPGRCYAVEADAGEVVIVPEGWAHCTVNADPEREMTFGAWCVRDYGFDYQGVRAHHGVAFFPEVAPQGGLRWVANPAYHAGELKHLKARSYDELGLRKGVSIYRQYQERHELFDFVARPVDDITRLYLPE